MQRLERLGPVLAGPSSLSGNESTAAGAADAIPQNRRVPVHFGPDGVFVLDIPPPCAPDSKAALTWDSLIEHAMQHPTVLSYFDRRTVDNVPKSSFAVVVPGTYTGTEDFLIKHGSAIGAEIVEVDFDCSTKDM
jgi:hypothetical protein